VASDHSTLTPSRNEGYPYTLIQTVSPRLKKISECRRAAKERASMPILMAM